MKQLILTLAVASMWTPSASAYCIGGDTCPSSDTNLEVFEICGNAGTGTCIGTLGPTSTQINLVRGRVPVYVHPGWEFRDVLGACINDGINPSFHRLRHSSYRGGSMIQWTSQRTDMAFCTGSGDDRVAVGTTSNGNCNGVITRAWNYGATNYWLELWGQAGSDSLQGGSGHDRICGGTGDDMGPPSNPASRSLYGWSGADDIDGWTGNDWCDSYTGAGDQAWGYDGEDYAMDLVWGPGDTVFGEDDADVCVYIDESTGTSPDLEINGGTAGCNPGSCSCGTGADDSCFDRSANTLSMTVGIELAGPQCPTD